MGVLEWVSVSYLVFALISFAWRRKGDSELRQWTPPGFSDRFTAPIPNEQSLIRKGKEIPPDTPTCLIVGGLRTQSPTIRYADFFSNILTFGWLRFNEIKPEGEPLDLVLCFENISRNNQAVLGGETEFYVVHPENPELSRRWPIVIPELQAGKTQIEKVTSFFTPETSGTHEFVIAGLAGLAFAGPYGVGGREFRIAGPEGPWMLAFHVSSSYEYKIFLVSFVALAVAVLSLAVAFLGAM